MHNEMGRDPEIDQLTQEWRAAINKRLDKQDEQLEAIKVAQTQLMLNSSTSAALGELEKRVRELEKFQIKAVTVIAVAQIVIAVAWALITKVWK